MLNNPLERILNTFSPFLAVIQSIYKTDMGLCLSLGKERTNTLSITDERISEPTMIQDKGHT